MVLIVKEVVWEVMKVIVRYGPNCEGGGMGGDEDDSEIWS